MQLINQVVNI